MNPFFCPKNDIDKLSRERNSLQQNATMQHFTRHVELLKRNIKLSINLVVPF